MPITRSWSCALRPTAVGSEFDLSSSTAALGVRCRVSGSGRRWIGSHFADATRDQAQAPPLDATCSRTAQKCAIRHTALSIWRHRAGEFLARPIRTRLLPFNFARPRLPDTIRFQTLSRYQSTCWRQRAAKITLTTKAGCRSATIFWNVISESCHLKKELARQRHGPGCQG